MVVLCVCKADVWFQSPPSTSFKLHICPHLPFYLLFFPAADVSACCSGQRLCVDVGSSAGQSCGTLPQSRQGLVCVCVSVCWGWDGAGGGCVTFGPAAGSCSGLLSVFDPADPALVLMSHTPAHSQTHDLTHAHTQARIRMYVNVWVCCSTRCPNKCCWNRPGPGGTIYHDLIRVLGL